MTNEETKSNRPPDWLIAAVCTGCGHEGDVWQGAPGGVLSGEFTWHPSAQEGRRFRCERCGAPAHEIPLQWIAARGGLLTMPNHYDRYRCENCESETRWGPIFLTIAPGEPAIKKNLCGTCAMAAVQMVHDREAVGRPPELRDFVRAMAATKEMVAKRRVIVPGA
jgi:hypothetical protein